MGLLGVFKHLRRVVEWASYLGDVVLVLMVLQGANQVLVSADTRLVEGLFQQTGVDIKPVSSQIIETYEGSHRLDCPLHCARSMACLSYSMTNMTSSSSNVMRFVCHLSDFSSLGSLLKTSQSPEATMYAKKILVCGPVDPPTEASSSSKDELEMTVVNKSGRKIHILHMMPGGPIISIKMALENNREWNYDSAMERNYYMATDEHGQIVPLNGKCHFTKGPGTERIIAKF